MGLGAAIGADHPHQPLGHHQLDREGHHVARHPMSSRRMGVVMASLVCRVDRTRWPVMAARMPISAVSWSRISPIRTMWILAQHGAGPGERKVDLFSWT